MNQLQSYKVTNAPLSAGVQMKEVQELPSHAVFVKVSDAEEMAQQLRELAAFRGP